MANEATVRDEGVFRGVVLANVTGAGKSTGGATEVEMLTPDVIDLGSDIAGGTAIFTVKETNGQGVDIRAYQNKSTTTADRALIGSKQTIAASGGDAFVANVGRYLSVTAQRTGGTDATVEIRIEIKGPPAR